MSNLEQIKSLREKTGAGMVDVKKALEESKGDEEKAIEILRKSGKDKALKKSRREVSEGVIAIYVHSKKVDVKSVRELLLFMSIPTKK
jgi:elongation factor Ts